MYYPVFLDLRGGDVLVVGAGKVALRKTRALIEADANVTVVSPEALPEFEKLPVRWIRRRFRRNDVRDQRLVFAATNDRVINARVAAVCHAKCILVNVADAPTQCSFLVPARITAGPLQVAVSTGGTDPKLAVEIRREIEGVLSRARMHFE